MNNIDWDGIRFFLAVAELGSLSAAAKKLTSNQPTVGRHINLFEKDLGVKLFQRSVKGLCLTFEGEKIYKQSQLIQNHVVKIQRTVQSENNDFISIIKLSIPEGIYSEVLVTKLHDFYKKNPKINLKIDLSISTANLSSGEADIAIRLYRPKETNLVIKKLGNMQMALCSSKKYLNAFSLPESLSDLSQHKIISYGNNLLNLPENQWLLKHTENAAHILSSDSTIGRLKATISGCGISIQPLLFLKSNPELLPLLKSETLPSHDVWLVYHSDLRKLSRIRVVLDFLSDSISHALTNIKKP